MSGELHRAEEELLTYIVASSHIMSISIFFISRYVKNIRKKTV